MNLFEFIKAYKWRIIAVVIAIVFTVLIFAIGFWRTLLLFVLVGIAYFIGNLIDEGGRDKVVSFFKTLFGRKSN